MIIYLRNKIKKIFFFVILLSSDQFSIPRIVVNTYIAKDTPKDISQYILAKVFNSLNNISKKNAVLAGVGTVLVFSSLFGYHLYRKWKDEELQQKKDIELKKKKDIELQEQGDKDDQVIKKLEELVKKENNSDSDSLSQGEKKLYENYPKYIAILRVKKIFEDIDEKIQYQINAFGIKYKDISFKKINAGKFLEKNMNIVISIRILNEINKLLIDLITVNNLKIKTTEDRLINLEKNNNKYYKITNNPFPYYVSNKDIHQQKDIVDQVNIFNKEFKKNNDIGAVQALLPEYYYNPLISFLKDKNYWIFWCILQANERVLKEGKIDVDGKRSSYTDLLKVPFLANEKVDLSVDNLIKIRGKIQLFENRVQKMNFYKENNGRIYWRHPGGRDLVETREESEEYYL